MLRYSLDHAGLFSKLRVGLIVERAARQARLLLCVCEVRRTVRSGGADT